MVGDDYVVEIKVSNKPLEQIVVKYNDQVQWQMHVMGAEKALVALEDRESQEISSQWIERDDDRIAALSGAADQFLESLDQANSIWDSDIDIDDWDAFFIEQELDAHSPSSRNLLSPLEPNEDSPQLLDSAYVSSAFRPAGANSGKRVIFQDIAEDDAEQESSKPPAEGENFAEGNPFREIRLRLGVSQADFRSKFDFGKMTMVYLENGMYTGISARQEAAIQKLAEENYFDLSAFLRREYETENLNDAYKKWQRISRHELAREKLEKIPPPFPFTFEQSPLFFIIRQHFDSIQRFCKIMKIPSVTITRHLDGETLAIPSVLIEALKDTGYTHIDDLLLAQNSWVVRFRGKGQGDTQPAR
jgi:transcriptional regulator with XRE-family HTH domain